MAELKDLLNRGVLEIIDRKLLLDKLNSGRKLIVKLGIDPTNKDLHIGHYLVLQKLRDFQDAGHEAVLVIGDFTARIGDPSGKDTKRMALNRSQIKENMRYYTSLAGKIIDLQKARIEYNSSWFDKLGMDGLINLAGKATFAQVMERKEFRRRLKQDDLSLLEFLYPLLQAYDSVVLRADVEIGGQDQKLNLLMGRQIQKKYNQPEQDIVLTPLLIGLDTRAKMSKTAGNYVAMTDPPNEMFGKIMSIPDILMKDYFVYCTRVPLKDIGLLFSRLSSGQISPMNLKKRLASELVNIYYGKNKAGEAAKEFERVFQKGERTSTVQTSVQPRSILPISYATLATISGATSSVSEAVRLADNNGLKVGGRVVANPRELIKKIHGPETIIDVGKRKSVKIIWK